MVKGKTRRIAERYVGRLDEIQTADGIMAVKANVGQIVSAAEVLASAGIYSLSCAFSILAIEEAQKVSVLLNLLYADKPEEIRTLWIEFRNHKKKYEHLAVNIVSHSLVTGEITPDDDAIEKKLAECPDPNTLEELKQGLIYCDCIRDERGTPIWSNPSSIEDRAAADAERLLASARDAFDHIHSFSKEELVIWKKHIAPNRLKPIKELLEHLDKCRAELNYLAVKD